MDNKFIDFNDLVKKPEYTYLVGAGSLFISVIDDGDLIEYKLDFSVKNGEFSEYFYKTIENNMGDFDYEYTKNLLF